MKPTLKPLQGKLTSIQSKLDQHDVLRLLILAFLKFCLLFGFSLLAYFLLKVFVIEKMNIPFDIVMSLVAASQCGILLFDFFFTLNESIPFSDSLIRFVVIETAYLIIAFSLLIISSKTLTFLWKAFPLLFGLLAASPFALLSFYSI